MLNATHATCMLNRQIRPGVRFETGKLNRKKEKERELRSSNSDSVNILIPQFVSELISRVN